jgi:tetratricopeptide (TPR) repeat protein
MTMNMTANGMRADLKVGPYLLVCVLLVAVTGAQSDSREQLTKGEALWGQRLSKSAIAAFQAAARDPKAAAEAHEAIGRIYMFKGWQQEGVFPGWHDEPEYRERAIAELKAAVAADPSRTSAQEALRQAQAFAAADKVDPETPRAEVKALDAKIESYRAAKDVPVPEILATVEARAAMQADPAPYFTAAQILLDRREFARATELAQKGAAAAERFITENEGAYKMSGKTAGARARSRATATDLIGWAAFLQNDYTTAAARLEEAERLSRGQDFVNQFHLAELAQARKQIDRAREHYLNALSLTGGPAPLRERAMQAAAHIHASLESPVGFDAWLDEELTRRREERKAAALRSLVDRPLPALSLTTVDGRAADVKALRGKVLLLNFFSSW